MWTERTSICGNSGLERRRTTIAIICGITEGWSSRKNHLNFCHTILKIFWLCGSQQTVTKFSRDGNIRGLFLEKLACSSQKQQLDLNMKQQIGPKIGKRKRQDCYCHPALFTYMQRTAELKIAKTFALTKRVTHRSQHSFELSRASDEPERVKKSGLKINICEN